MGDTLRGSSREDIGVWGMMISEALYYQSLSIPSEFRSLRAIKEVKHVDDNGAKFGEWNDQ